MRPTGVTSIDRVIGGFAPGRPLVLAGPDAADRSALALSLAQHALARGETVRLVTREPAPSLLRRGRALGIDLGSLLDDGRLGLFELRDDAPALLHRHGLRLLTDALRSDLDGAALVVVDSFSTLLAEIADAAKLREMVRGFVRALDGCTVVLGVDSARSAAQRGLDAALAEIGAARFELPHEATGATASTAAEPARSKILVVEDDRLQREMLRDWLSPHHEVSCAGDGFEAFSMLLADPPDLVVLDLVLPRVTGHELLQSMRRARFEMPVLVTSARVATAGDRLGPLVLGATEFLAKPVARLELLHKVETLLRLPREGARSRFAASEEDAQALFGSFSRSRLLESAEFADRVGRACTFGRKHGLSSCLLGLAADSAAALDHWVEVANRHLRYEDAILRTDKQVAVMLLVATDPRYAPRVLERLAAAAGDPMPEIASTSWLARPEHAEAGAIEALLDPLRHPSEATP